MLAQNELWSENALGTPNEILGAMIRDELAQERVLRIDATYLGHAIGQWWNERAKGELNERSALSLRMLIVDTLKLEHLTALREVGSKKSRNAALLFERCFNVADKDLARLVHEALSDIAGLIDLQYPYEDHKELSPKQGDTLASDWGRGMGIIRPHSDDLYEERAVTLMTLTVCKDTSSTPTWFWLLRDIVKCLTDEELGVLATAEANFLSGTNVNGRTIVATKPVLYRDPIAGLGLRLDFRIDDAVGARMRFEANTQADHILSKMRSHLRNIPPMCSVPVTGSFSILSNHKILHGRSALNSALLTDGESSRILFRSKGIKS